MISLLSNLYARSGGRAAVSPSAKNGPFSEFLRAIWELLPREVRTRNVDTFVRRAQITVLKSRERNKVAWAQLSQMEPDPHLIRLFSEMADNWENSMAEMREKRATR